MHHFDFRKSSHLQPLGSHLLKQPLGSPLQPLACSSSHLQPLASHLLKQPLGSHLLKQPAATCCCCSHLGQASASGCKWLQVAAKWLLEQVAASGCLGKWLQLSGCLGKWLQVAATDCTHLQRLIAPCRHVPS